MAVKFSQFTGKTNFTDVDNIVGYTGTANVQIPPANLDTTYVLSTTQATNDVDLRLTGTKAGTAGTTEDVKFVAGTAISLTAGTDQMTIANTGVTSFTNTNGTYISAATANSSATGAVTTGVIDLSAGTPSSPSTEFLRGDNTWAVPTDVANTYTLPISGTSSAVTATLTGSAGDTDPVLITAGSDISFGSITSAGFTINSTATGDTYDLNATTDGSNVDLNITSGSGTDNSTVQLTAGTGITLTRNSSAEVTIDGTASATKLVVTKTGNNSDTVFTDITTGLTLPVSNSKFYVDIYISGVYQQKSTYAYTTATNGTITFTIAPPVTATDGLEFVTTV